MSEPTNASPLGALLGRILAAPASADLWQLQMELLARGDAPALAARQAAGRFFSFLQGLESKTASRRASRWGAALGTAAVASVGLQEMLAEQADPLRRLVASGVTAMLDVGAAVKSVQAWEIEAALVYYDVVWYLCGELWDVSLTGRPELKLEERQAYVDQLLKPLIDKSLGDAIRSALIVRLFQVVLAGRVSPLLA